MTDPTPTPRTPAASDTDLTETQMQQPESTLFGGYEILSEVSRGGMGVVYKARQLSLGRVVALKLVLSGSDASDSELQRFQEEAKAAAQLDHPHIVPVYEIGEHDGQHFFSMGFVDGPSLSMKLAQSGPLLPQDAAEILRKIAEAVDYAHRQGVIHRDLKPGNVLLTSSGEPKVTDFGLAKRLESDQSLTATGQVFGTPAFMSPEQAQGDHEVIGPASDVYSLGATLFASLTGRPPFTSTVIHELLIQVTEEQPPSLRTLNANVPAALEAICLKCLSKSPVDRYPSARALAEDLGRFLGSERVVAARRSLTSRFGRWIAAVAVVGIAMIAGIWFGRNKTAVLPPAASSHSEVASTASSTTATAIVQKLQPADEKLLQALTAARDAMLPTPTGNVWLYRYADGAVACEKAFHEFGFLVDKGDPSQVAESLARRSGDFRESVICGLELWELCAAAAKQTAVIEPLRQAQDALDTLAWRRSLRLARADADEKIFLLAVREGISQSPTPEQFAILAMQIACRPPNLSTEALATLRILRQQTPDEYRINLTLAISLQIYGRTNPDKKSSCASESVIPLRAAAKALPASALPYMQLAAVYKDLDNVEAAAIESDRGYQVLSPEAWPLIVAARKVREKGEFSNAIQLIREALVKQPNVSFGDVELAANLILNGQDSEAEPWLKKVANGSPDPTVSFEGLEEVFRIVESSSPDGRKIRNAAVMGNGARELAWNCYCNFRSKLGKTFPPLALAPFDAEQAKAHQATCATSLGLPVEYTNSLGMKFRLIPPGEYLRGSTEEEMALVRHDHPRNPHWVSAVDSEGPRHRVILTKPFYLSIYETRQSDYETLVGVNPAQFSGFGKEKSKVVGIDTSKYPVENVNWNDVAEFCAKLSRREQLAPFYSRSGEVVTVLYSDGYRLPTEAEWEFACRAGTTTIYWTGESESGLQDCEWYVNNSGGVPHPVGELAANPFGLFDMAGNIYEWCQDAYAKDSYSRYAHQTAMDPLVKPEEQVGKPVRKCRGGGFSVFGVAGCRSAFRNNLGVTEAGRTAGFRVALSIEGVRQLLKQPTSSVPHVGPPDAPKPSCVFGFERSKYSVRQTKHVSMINLGFSAAVSFTSLASYVSVPSI